MSYFTIDGHPIRWRDDRGVVHACEASDTPGGRLIWTLCLIDVPADAAEASHAKPTCLTCLRAGQTAVSIS